MLLNKKIIYCVSLIACFVFVTGIYDKVDFSTEKKVDCDIMQYESLYNPQILMPLNEKIYYVTQGLKKDLRPVKKEPIKVKGVYMSGNAFNSTILFSYLIDLVDKTELNAIVIDMKDDDGFLTTNFDIKLARDLKVRFHKGIDAEKNMNILLDKNIYPIARIVVFKDPSLAESKPEFALRCKDGTIWRDRKGLAWVDPHNKGVWEYTVDVAKEAAKMGFREIQFDYVRFPSDGNMGNVVYPHADGRKKEDVIKDFLKFAREELEPYNVYISADVFGLTTMTKDDMGIGQKFEKVITEVDYVCPMIYPSHYGKGNYGFANPNAYPYEIVKNALLDGLEKVGDSSVVIRPWLQDFNLGSPKYGANEVKAQINATYDVGLEEWILWNARNRYTAGALGEN
ncbi:MAG: putative glycoside hydrolase [Clostridia bacterium]|nr:putative glycoside hydrolase [Clostridia bacterium]